MFDVTLADEDACSIVVVDIIDLDIAVANSWKWKRLVDSYMTASSLTAWWLLQRLTTL